MRILKGFFVIVFVSIAFNLISDDRIEPEGVLYDLKYNIKKIIDQSELVFIGNLKHINWKAKAKKISENEYNLDLSLFNLKLYKINAKKILKGNINKNKKSLVVVDTAYKSSTSHLTPTIDNQQYIFFLKRINLNNEGLAKDVNYYALVKGWHGMIALKKEAKSQRSVRRIKEVYGIDVLENTESFINAVKLLADNEKPDEKTNKETKETYDKIIANTPKVDKFKKVLLLQNRKE